MSNLLARFDPDRISDILDTCGWSQEEEIETLVKIARMEEIKALPSALAAWKLLRDRQVEALQFKGLLQKIQGHIQGTTDQGHQAQITTTSYRLGDHTSEMLRQAFNPTEPKELPQLEGEIVEPELGDTPGERGLHPPENGGCEVQEEDSSRECAGESTPPDSQAGLVRRANRGNRESTMQPTGDAIEPEQEPAQETSRQSGRTRITKRAGKPAATSVEYGSKPPSRNLRNPARAGSRDPAHLGSAGVPISDPEGRLRPGETDTP